MIMVTKWKFVIRWVKVLNINLRWKFISKRRREIVFNEVGRSFYFFVIFELKGISIETVSGESGAKLAL